MRTKSNALSDTHFISLMYRLEDEIELLSRNNKIIAVTTTSGTTNSDGSRYYAAVFYEELDQKQPAVAKVIPIDGCRFHSSPEPECQPCFYEDGSYTCIRPSHGRLESATLIPPAPTLSLSEQMEAILEPRPWDDAKIAVNQHGKE